MSKNDKKGREHLPPVAWLLGRQLIASLKWILLYTAFGSKLDARDWMEAKVFPADNNNAAAEAWKQMRLKRERGSSTLNGQDYWDEKQGFWFDYLSDTGDGTLATYSLAYLCLSDLWLRAAYETGMPRDEDACVQLNKFHDDLHQARLPRGEFLVIGGDTSYHLSDYATLHLRFQKPFKWAYEDLSRDLGGQLESAESRADGSNRRPLFGIPGNHDYYDMLDGFRRQFRTPVSARPEDKEYGPEDLTGPQLMLDGFKRIQDTSYLALRLPFNWMLWGLDTEVGTIDERQRDFFKSTNGGVTPEKLIVATSAPTTVFGKRADREDEKCSKAFFQLKLARPFVDDPEAGEPELQPNQIRLDIAGDVHQYARYWGPKTSDINPRATSKKTAPTAKNYASVVSGLGGAFHHPSTTYVDEIKEQALYPREGRSRARVAKEIFNPVKVFRGGGVGVMGAALALILAFTALANDSARPAIHNFVPFVKLGLTEAERTQSTTVETLQTQTQATSTPSITNGQPTSVVPFGLWRRLGVTQETWEPQIDPSSSTRCGNNKLIYLWGDCSVGLPKDYVIGMVMLLLTGVVIILTFFLTERIYALGDKQQDVKKGAAVPHTKEEKNSVSIATNQLNKVQWILWLTLSTNVLLGIVGVLTIIPYRPFITPFGSSLWVFLTIVWAATSIIFSLRYSDWLFVQTSKITVTSKDWLITWALTLAVVASLAVGLWLFGKNNLPAFLVADIIFVTVVLASLIGLIYVAVTMGGQHQKGLGKAGMVLVGFWHWLLQLGVALLLLKKGTWLTVLLAIPIFFLFMVIGRKFLSVNYKWRLTTAWVAYGVVMLGLPRFVFWWLSKWPAQWGTLRNAMVWPYVFGPNSTFANYEWWKSFEGFWQLVPLALACLFGMVFSCIWVGWYFAVCLRFNGHNNETGGAARIENFKQFIRFRLRENDLTGYVIAVDDPKGNGKDLKAKLVDVFMLSR